MASLVFPVRFVLRLCAPRLHSQLLYSRSNLTCFRNFLHTEDWCLAEARCKLSGSSCLSPSVHSRAGPDTQKVTRLSRSIGRNDKVCVVSVSRLPACLPGNYCYMLQKIALPLTATASSRLRRPADLPRLAPPSPAPAAPRPALPPPPLSEVVPVAVHEKEPVEKPSVHHLVEEPSVVAREPIVAEEVREEGEVEERREERVVEERSEPVDTVTYSKWHSRVSSPQSLRRVSSPPAGGGTAHGATEGRRECIRRGAEAARAQVAPSPTPPSSSALPSIMQAFSSNIAAT